jgi:hypothetical protein
MGRRRNFAPKTPLPIPSEFNLNKYDFKGDYELWLSALTLRVELKKEVEEFLAWRVPELELSEERSEIYDYALTRLQIKILSLLDSPVQQDQAEESNDQAMAIKDQVSLWLRKPDAVSDRTVADELLSATKLDNDVYRRLFDREFEKYNQRSDCFFASGLLGIPLRHLFGETHGVGDATNFLNGYSIWRADIQMPNFSGEFGVKVNLYHDDEVLISEFRKWLRATRAAAVPNFSTNKGITARTLEEWAEMRLVPYIDLWLYQKMFGETFPFSDIGEILFHDPNKPKNEDDGDWTKRARDTHKRAMELMNPLSFYALRNNG